MRCTQTNDATNPGRPVDSARCRWPVRNGSFSCSKNEPVANYQEAVCS